MHLHFKTLGDGPALIILHGLFGMGDNFQSVASELAREFKVYLVDQRNHGRSAHSDVFGYDALSDDLAEFFYAQRIGMACLLGHSMGGKTAMHFTFQFPELVEKLIVADMSPAPRSITRQHLDVLYAMLGMDLKSYTSRAEIEKALEIALRSEKLRKVVMKNLYRTDDHSFAWRPNITAINQNISQVFKGIAPPPVACPIPTLFLKGEFSDYIPKEDEELIRSMFSSVSFATIARASHWLHADNPEDFVREVKHFLINN